MRRTLTTAMLTLAILTPGAAAFADTGSSINASCNNMQGGNGAYFNGNGGPAVGLDLTCAGRTHGGTVTDPPVTPTWSSF